MTAAQNTIQVGRPNRLGGLAAAAAIGLTVAVVGVAVSARPIIAPASEAALAAVPALAPSQTSSLAFEELLSTAHAPAVAPNLAFEELLSKAHAPAFASSQSLSFYLDQVLQRGQPSALTPREQLDATIQAQIQKHELDLQAQEQRVAFASGGWPVVSTLTPREQLDATIQAQIQKHELDLLAQKLAAAAARLGGPHRG